MDGRGAAAGRRARQIERDHVRPTREGRRVRFWATPERVAIWNELHAAGVDLINTDDLAGLAKFLNSE